jgi:hypothetical protein
MPNQSPEPTAVIAAVAIHAANRRWLSFGLGIIRHKKNMNTKLIRYSFFSLAFILSAFSSFALELKSEDLNYIVTIPGTWTVQSQDQTGFYIKSQDGKKALSLVIIPARFAIDSDYIARIEQVMKKVHNLELVSSKIFTIDGVPAYEDIQRLGEAPIASVKVEHQIIAGGRLYSLDSVIFGGDATQDSELQAGLASFHFLHQPKPPGKFGFGSLGVKLAILGVIIVSIFLVIRSRRA